MSKKIHSITKSLFLIILILVIFLLGYFVFISGPLRVYETEDMQYLQTLRNYDSYKTTTLTLLNRFSFDEVYYIVESSENDTHEIVWFNKDHSLLNSKEYKEMNGELLTQFDMSSGSVDYGVYKEGLVYVLKEGNHEIYLDYDSLEPVFEVGRIPYVVD